MSSANHTARNPLVLSTSHDGVDFDKGFAVANCLEHPFSNNDQPVSQYFSRFQCSRCEPFRRTMHGHCIAPELFNIVSAVLINLKGIVYLLTL
jgi:hypothetical protein